MFGTRDDSVELMMQNSTSLASSSRKKPSGDVIINEQSSGQLGADRRTGHDPGYLLPFDFTGELAQKTPGGGFNSTQCRFEPFKRKDLEKWSMPGPDYYDAPTKMATIENST